MKHHTRRAVAYIAARKSTYSQGTNIYDYTDGSNTSLSGQVSTTQVSVYDYGQSCFVTGSGDSLYHYGNNAYISLTSSTSKFSGYDYDSGQHFSGTISGSSITLYDYETGSYYNFSA